MTGSGAAVSVADLTFNYGAMSVLEQISLDVPTRWTGCRTSWFEGTLWAAWA